jgi:hypothetical protein
MAVAEARGLAASRNSQTIPHQSELDRLRRRVSHFANQMSTYLSQGYYADHIRLDWPFLEKPLLLRHLSPVKSSRFRFPSPPGRLERLVFSFWIVTHQFSL